MLLGWVGSDWGQIGVWVDGQAGLCMGWCMGGGGDEMMCQRVINMITYSYNQVIILSR